MKKYYVNLQLFAGEKTEKPTPKKLEDARKKGQVAKSVEINSAVILLVTLIFLRIFMGDMVRSMEALFITFFQFDSNSVVTIESVQHTYITTLMWLGRIVLPIMILSMIAGVMANYLQIGFLFTTEPLQMKLEKIDPIKGFKKIFSKRTLMELVKSIFKIAGILYLSYTVIRNRTMTFPQFMDMDIQVSLVFIGELIFAIIWRVLLFLLVLAIIDFVFQKYDYTENQKMSKQEIKDEYKNVEGDPLIKSKIKEKQRQMAMSRMMQELPTADVVITNPTHFAVALKYSQGMAAPKVIAKGQDYVALKIREAAKENKIILYEDKPLARALYYNVEIGQEIPGDMFQAVAEVLAYVYKLKNKII